MCGLVGVAGDVTHQVTSVVFRDMLDVCQVRGRDSTGVIRVNQRNEMTWVKQVGPPAYLCDSRQYEQKVERGLASALIGHCRSKTSGDVSVKNAHPFEIGRICGVHNGTLTGHHSLDTYEYNKVDSEVLYGHLERNGPDDTFAKVEGAYACVWWDDDEKTLNFIRNTARPLWFTWSKDAKMMFWASELWMLSAVSRKVALWDGGEDGKVFIELPPHKLWSFTINPNPGKDKPVLTLAQPREIKLKEKEKPASNAHDFRRPVSNVVSRSEWERLGDGTYERKVNLPSADGGSSVPDPFRGASLLDGDWAEALDDEVPWLLRNPDRGPRPRLIGIPPGATNSSSSKPASSTGSAGSSASTKPSKSTNERPGNVISLREKNSLGSRSSSSDELYLDGGSTSTRSHSSPILPTGVSLRTVVGINYICDNRTKVEWQEQDFLVNTGGCCTFCKTPLEGLRDVGTILSKSSYICRDCLHEPKISFGGQLAC